MWTIRITFTVAAISTEVFDHAVVTPFATIDLWWTLGTRNFGTLTTLGFSVAIRYAHVLTTVIVARSALCARVNKPARGIISCELTYPLELISQVPYRAHCALTSRHCNIRHSHRVLLTKICHPVIVFQVSVVYSVLRIEARYIPFQFVVELRLHFRFS